MRTWQRRHGRDVIAQVKPIEALGVWEPSAWRTDAPQDIAQGAWVELLTNAHSEADRIARNVFAHQCDATCSNWIPEERRKHPR